MKDISEIFRKSPFEPIQEHMHVALSCAELIKPLFEALASEKYASIQEISEQISELEEKSDQIKKGIQKNLPNNLFLAVSRRDLIQVVNVQDSICDTTEEIGKLLTLRKSSIPDKLNHELFELIDQVLVVCKIANSVTEELLEIYKRSFGGPEVDKIQQLLDELENAETKTSKMGTELCKHLFELEDELSAVSVIFWFHIIEKIKLLADFAKKMGNRIRLLIAK